jgi:KDO2-lipid IV(A) lauroyltransferase
VAPFFGRPAHCERAVAVFARRLGVPVVFGACYRTERRWHYRMVFTEVLRPEDLAGLSPEAVTTRINAELERMIRACPEQYFWLHDRYRGAPPPQGG